MYTTFLTVHNGMRWVILLGLAFVLLRAYLGRFGVSPWVKRDTVAMRATVVGLDVQLLIGLVLYVFLSPLSQSAFADFGAAMKDKQLRFFAVEHTFGMLVALGLAHVGSARVKRATDALVQARRASLWFSLALVALLASIPWWR